METPVSTEKGETYAKKRMTRWQRELELYMNCPEESGVDLLKLLRNSSRVAVR